MFEAIAFGDHGWSAGLPHAGVVGLHARFAAVAVGFPLLCWPGRAHYDGHRVRQRVVVFERATRARGDGDAARGEAGGRAGAALIERVGADASPRVANEASRR